MGRYIAGKAMCLYDGEYREDDADFEPCFPIRKEIAADGVHVRQLPGGRCLTLIHRGPYDQLGRSYAKILQHATERKLKPVLLPRARNLRQGPGMIFKGNPKNYLTEIELLLFVSPGVVRQTFCPSCAFNSRHVRTTGTLRDSLGSTLAVTMSVPPL